ncbi:darcynin family protein [Burkholderia puraquae]|uniref:darcynin family protein n=1 Tax=Burkholderia puraquae TaxID=1904757 RepID=UPI003CC5B9A0
MSPRVYGTPFYSARVTDVRIRNAQDRHACKPMIDALRERPFRDRDFDIVEILASVENVSAANGDDAVAPLAVEVHAARRRGACAPFCAVVLSMPPANQDDCCNMRNNCCRT